MADELLSVEARLKDYISQNLKTIESNLRNFTDVSKRELQKQSENNSLLAKSTQQLSSAWDVLGIATKSVIGVVGGLAIFNKVTGYLKESTIEISKQIEADAQLASAIGYTSKALLENASAIQNRTTFADDDIEMAEAAIASFIKEEDSIKLVTRAAIDFATAKRIDVVTAADLMTKSIVSGTNAMSRYGIQIKDTNNVEERLKSVVENVNKAFGGRAEALAQTDAGKIKQINNLIGEQQELIGKQLLPMMREWYSLLLSVSRVSTGPLTTLLRGLNIELKLLKGNSIESVKTTNYISEAMQKGGQEGASYLFDRLTEVNKAYVDLKQKKKDFESGKSVWNINPATLKDYEAQVKAIRSAMSTLTTPIKANGETPDTTGKKDGAEDTAKKEIERVQRLDKLIYETMKKDLDDQEELRRTAKKKQFDAEDQAQEILLSKAGIQLQKEAAQLKQGEDYLTQIKAEGSQKNLFTKIKFLNAEADAQIKAWEKSLTDLRLIEDLKTQITEQTTRKRIALYVGEAQNFISTLSTMLSAWQTYQSTKRSAEYQTEVDRIKGMKLSSVQEEKLLKQAEERNREKAKKEQNMAVAIIRINEAMAIVKAYYESGPYLGTVYAAMIEATSEFQIATVRAQKLASGGTVRTFLGEQGSEYVPGYGTVTKPSYHDLPIGSQVINNTDTKQMSSKNTIIFQLPAGTPIDSIAADRMEDVAKYIGEVLEIADRDGRLSHFKSIIK